MIRREIWKGFFKKTALSVIIACFLFFMLKNVFTNNGETNYFYVWLVPYDYSIDGTVWGIVALIFRR